MARAILGISAFYHDSAAAIIVDGKIVAAGQEERFSRKKHDERFPKHAVAYCLEEAGLRVSQLDAVAFYDKPWLKFERLLETYYAFAPKGLTSFLKSTPVWIKEKIFQRDLLKEELEKIAETPLDHLKLLFPEHHLSHAASAFYPAPFDEAAILTIDGVGEWACGSILHGKGSEIKMLREQNFPHSLGLLYSAFTYFLGFRVNSGEYKLMGLAPYGDPTSAQVAEFCKIIKSELIDLKDDGSMWLNQDHFNYATGLRMVKDDSWAKMFGFARRANEEEWMQQHHCNLALAIQQVTEEAVLLQAKAACELAGSRNLCMAGGVALNCVANGKLQRSGIVDELYVQPAAGDAGGAVGAALVAHHTYFKQERVTPAKPDAMQGSYLGPFYSSDDAIAQLKRYAPVYERIDHEDALCKRVAGLLSEGGIVGWFQGRMEFGPRALGARSILGDPRDPTMQKRLNLDIKYREGFRPFAPSVLAEDSKDYFDLDTDSPYMLLVCPVQESRRNPLPDDYHEREILDKLYVLRSDIPAVTHIDFSARVQSVHKETNPRYHKLISSFKEQTGYSLLVNTSFNVRGEPIVCTPEDAYRCFMRTEIDALVVDNLLFLKTEQTNVGAFGPPSGGVAAFGSD